MKSRIPAIVAIFTIAISLHAAIPGNQALIDRIPDNAWARQQVADSLVDPIGRLTAKQNRLMKQLIEPRSVKFKVIRDEPAGFVYLVFLNQVGKSWPDLAPGNVIVRRALRGGGVDQVKFFLSNDPLVFIRVTKAGSRSLLSIFFRDNLTPLYRDLPLPLPIERIALTPLASIVKMTDAKVVWRLFLDRPDASQFDAVNAMIKKIRADLPYLPDADDGAMDDSGRLVKIASITATGKPGFNCSGFAKWVADGLYWPLAIKNEGKGRYLKIEDLRERLVAYRNDPASDPFEESRDPWFGLDWVRNIASRLASLRLGKAVASPEDWDVRTIPFMHYTEDRGYPVTELEKALYLLAMKEPGNIYMAAVNGDFGSQPVLWQYFHIVVLMPAFDASGRFHCTVFERNVETSLTSLSQRYPIQFAHLVRIRASGEFDPPRIQ